MAIFMAIFMAIIWLFIWFYYGYYMAIFIWLFLIWAIFSKIAHKQLFTKFPKLLFLLQSIQS